MNWFFLAYQLKKKTALSGRHLFQDHTRLENTVDALLFGKKRQ
jgi:hypothetical protein